MSGKRTTEAPAESIRKKTKLSSLDHLRKHSIIVVDTSDLNLISQYQPEDATTNPSLILRAHQSGTLTDILDECVRLHTSDIKKKRRHNTHTHK